MKSLPLLSRTLLPCLFLAVAGRVDAADPYSHRSASPVVRRVFGGIVPSLAAPKGVERTAVSLVRSDADVAAPLKMLRGGACSDSNPALFAKIGLGAVAEAATLLAVLVGSGKLSENVAFLPSFLGLPVLQWIGLLAVIFGSALFGSLIDGGLSAASRQVLDPNDVAGDPEWYSGLSKPSWNPPGWLFPIMWLVVSKPTQAVAVSRILALGKGDGSPDTPLGALAVYCLHLALGDAWNKVFFGLQCTGRGAAVITVFYGVLLASTFLFHTIDPLAGKFMLPTCGWVTVATALNWNIYLNNN